MVPLARLIHPRALARFLPVALAIAGALPAWGKVADPRNCTIDPVLVGTSSGAYLPGAGATAAPGFDIVAHDVNNVPIPGRVVTLTLLSPNLTFLDVQNPGVGVQCFNRSIALVTDLYGHVCFGARIAGYDNAPGAVQIDVDGVILALVPARSTDLYGMDGTTDLNDLRVFREGFFSTAGAGPELDFNLDGRVDSGDLQIFRDEFFRHASAAPCP
jgi:hypothetical protein